MHNFQLAQFQLHFIHITSKFCIVAKFPLPIHAKIFNIKFVDVFVIYLTTKFHIPN